MTGKQEEKENYGYKSKHVNDKHENEASYIEKAAVCMERT
jgi:hypothetical protein